MRGGYRYNAGRPGWRRKCEHKLRFDIRVLHRKGRLAAGQYFSWYWSRDEERVATISVMTFPGAVELEYTWTPHGCDARHVRCRVELARRACRFGGERSWFQCPDCGRMCAVLFGLSRRGNFACRVCQRLTYASEAESPIDRSWRAQRKLEARLTDQGKRPTGMRRRTFERICEKLGAIEERRDELLWPSFLRIAGHLGVNADDLL